jgi:starch synthase
MPAYDAVRANGFEPAAADPNMVGFAMGGRSIVADLGHLDLGEIPVTLLDIPSLYHRGDLYSDAPDEHLRFGALSRAALEVCRRWDWAPDVIHCNDWQTGLIPLYLRTTERRHSLFASTKTVLTIHNLGYQGVFGAGVTSDLGLAEHSSFLHQQHLTEGRVGFLETGIMYADALTTVSPTYAREILTPEFGAGLDQLLLGREEDVVGILNGIDTDVWNPASDPHLRHRYSSKSLWRKEWAKRDLLEGLGLEYRERIPVFGIVSRLVSQKGIGLLFQPMAGVLEATDARFVALGSGDPDLESGMRRLADRFPDQVRFVAGHDEPLAHRIEAGIDVFLMPSLYEPCGLNQMYSLAYGTAPLVRRTGGLADTVEHWEATSRTGTGFVFEHFDEGGVWWALNQALEAQADHSGWKQLQLNGMAIDNSWARRAEEYIDLYERLANGPVR